MSDNVPSPKAARICCSVVSGASDAILRFLESMATASAHVDAAIEVTAVINANDSALAMKAQKLADRVILRIEPMGFAANHNEVMRTTAADFYIVANDDVIVDDDCLAILLAVMQSSAHSDVAVVSPMLRNPDGSLQPSTYGFPSCATVFFNFIGLRAILPDRLTRRITHILRGAGASSRYWNHAEEVLVDTLRGAFVMVRAVAVQDVGLMSEVAIVGGEEVEWHARMQDRGWHVLFSPQACVTHIGRVTTGGRPDLELEYIKGTLNFFAQHRGRCSYGVVKCLAYARTLTVQLHSMVATGRRIPARGNSLASIQFRRAWLSSGHLAEDPPESNAPT